MSSSRVGRCASLWLSWSSSCAFSTWAWLAWSAGAMSVAIMTCICTRRSRAGRLTSSRFSASSRLAFSSSKRIASSAGATSDAAMDNEDGERGTGPREGTGMWTERGREGRQTAKD